MTETPITTDLRLPSRLGFEKVAMNTAASVARLMGFSEDRVEDLKTAVAEACINAIEHGNRMDESLSVLVTLAMDGNTLEVKVADRGTGTGRRTAAPDIDRKLRGEEEARGLGKFLIESLVDEAEWVKKRNGSYARLTIHLDKDKASAQGPTERE